MNRNSKRTDRRALISGVEMLEGRKLMAADETAQIISNPLGHGGHQREISRLALTSTGVGQGIGSFNVADDSPLAKTVRNAISSGRMMVEVEFRVEKPNGTGDHRVLDLDFTSIVDKPGQNPKNGVDHVEFTFFNPKDVNPSPLDSLAALKEKIREESSSSDFLGLMDTETPSKSKKIL